MTNWKQILAGCCTLLITLQSFSFFDQSEANAAVLARKIAEEYLAHQQARTSPPLQCVAPEEIVASEPSTTLSQKDRDALILNAFNEARGEGEHGIKAVLAVTMARVNSACYPDSVSDVVYQRYQFSWTHQRGTARTLASAARLDAQSLQQIKHIVDQYIAEGAKPSDALLYHATYVSPKWSRAPGVTRIKRVGRHLFYDLKDC